MLPVRNTLKQLKYSSRAIHERRDQLQRLRNNFVAKSLLFYIV